MRGEDGDEDGERAASARKRRISARRLSIDQSLTLPSLSFNALSRWALINIATLLCQLPSEMNFSGCGAAGHTQYGVFASDVPSIGVCIHRVAHAGS